MGLWDCADPNDQIDQIDQIAGVKDDDTIRYGTIRYDTVL